MVDFQTKIPVIAGFFLIQFILLIEFRLGYGYTGKTDSSSSTDSTLQKPNASGKSFVLVVSRQSDFSLRAETMM